MAKKKKAPSAPRKKAVHERPLKNRPVDPPEPDEVLDVEPEAGPESTGDDDQPEEEGEPLVTPAAPKRGRGRPKQARLPEMEDSAIGELESAAEDYASVRDKRMALNEEEHELKEDLLKLMHEHNKKKYFHNGIEIRVVAKDETVKVKISKD